MEDENGRPIQESQKSAARKRARVFWCKLLKRGIAPSSFCKLDIDIRDSYIALMEKSFPWLCLCENHWKSKKLWQNHYSVTCSQLRP